MKRPLFIAPLFMMLNLALCLSSCGSTKAEVIGVYVPKGYKNNFDTVELRSNGVYSRKIYDKNKKLVIETLGTWSLTNNKLRIPSFHLNLDADLVNFPKSLDSAESDIRTYFQSDNQTIEFCVGYYDKENCYTKIH